MELPEQIIEQIKTSFSISSIPVSVLKEFKAYCNEECGGVYSVGIIQLLKTKKLYEGIIPLFSKITERLDKLESSPIKTKELKRFNE